MFNPAFGISNKHFQTIYSSLFRKFSNIEFEIEKFNLKDSDFLECYWYKTNKHNTDTPIVILFHGLAGSYESPYIKGAMLALSNAGFDTVLMHFRACNGNDNILPRSYHSGDSGDALEFIASLKKRFPKSKLYALGYSLGANMLLKLLGELGNNSLIKKAIAVSPPMRLDICARRMNKGLSRYYQYKLLKDLNIALDKKYDKHDMQQIINLKRQDIQYLKTFYEFDQAYTAPIHGFKSAQDYYTKCSSKQFLKFIQTPTLIIHSKDDPFMTKEVIPTKDEISEKIELKITKKGGHIGFVGGTIFKPIYWLDKKIIDFFT